MTGLGEFLVDRLSRLLPFHERDVVIGDLAELHLGPLRSACEVCGLIGREQCRLWKDWRPWLALLGIAGLVGIRLNFLAGASLRFPVIYLRTHRAYGVIYQSGISPGRELIVWAAVAAAVVLWSWTAGLAFSFLARGTAVVTVILLGIAWLGWCGFVRRPVLVACPWSFVFFLGPRVLFLVPALVGARRGLRACADVPLRRAGLLLIATAAVTALVTWTSGWGNAGIEKWSEGALQGGPPWYQRIPPYLLLSWPAVWIWSESFLRNSRRLEP